MVEMRRVVVVGGSLFAETLVQVLGESPAVTVIGVAPSPEEAIISLPEQSPDAVIVAVADEAVVTAFAPILIAYPDLPLIHVDLNADQIQVITHHTIDAQISDLLAAIAALPRRELDVDHDTPAGRQ